MTETHTIHSALTSPSQPYAWHSTTIQSPHPTGRYAYECTISVPGALTYIVAISDNSGWRREDTLLFTLTSKQDLLHTINSNQQWFPQPHQLQLSSTATTSLPSRSTAGVERLFEGNVKIASSLESIYQIHHNSNNNHHNVHTANDSCHSQFGPTPSQSRLAINNPFELLSPMLEINDIVDITTDSKFNHKTQTFSYLPYKQQRPEVTRNNSQNANITAYQSEPTDPVVDDNWIGNCKRLELSYIV
jgi:hypothetical protein